jgi:starch phosphorylase
MTAAMNGSINLSIPDGWIPEFSKHGKNSFIITPAETENPDEQDMVENDTLLTLLEKEIAPLYYNNSKAWTAIVKQSMEDILPEFDSNRMAREYYEKMYAEEATTSRKTSNSKQFEVI